MVLFLELAAACAPKVPPDLLAMVATLESGVRPMAVSSGGKTEIATTVGDAVGTVVGLLDDSQDVGAGLMGLDARKLNGRPMALPDAFDACQSLEYVGRVMEKIFAAADRAGVTPSRAERLAIRAVFQLLSPRAGTAIDYEERIMRARADIQQTLPTLAISGLTVAGPVNAGGGSKKVLSNRSSAERGVNLGAPSAVSGARPEQSVTSGPEPEPPAWDVYRTSTSNGLVVFSK